jgi:hypothetical protein
MTSVTQLKKTRSVPSFRELDDLVLHLKGLVLVTGLRERNGADDDELGMYRAEIDRLRDELAEFVKTGAVAA